MRRELVVLSRSLPHHRLGGMEIVVWDLVVELARRGMEVRVITTAIPERGGEFMEDGVRVVALEGTRPASYSRAWWRESRRYFSTHCMDTVKGVLSVSAAGYGLFSLRKFIPGVKFVLQAHGTSWGEIVSKWRSVRVPSMATSLKNLAWLPSDMMAYRRFDAVVAVGERVKRDLTGLPIRPFLPEARVRLINNGIDTAIFFPSEDGRRTVRDRLGLSQNAPVVLSASRLHVQKGLDNGLKTFARLLQHRPEAVYLIAGEGPERARLEGLAWSLGIGHHVRFLGRLSRRDMADVMRAADVFLFLTDRVEGLPLNVLEALASGLWCVVSDHLILPDAEALQRVTPTSAETAMRAIAAQVDLSRSRARTPLLPERFRLAAAAEAYMRLFDGN